jgi:hypothetical protein
LSLKTIHKITIEFVDHCNQRYDTCGDWLIDPEGTLRIKVSKTEDPRNALAVAYHELIEALLCTHKGISGQEVDDFDMDKGAEYDEPGRHPSAPYHKEHIFATAAERRFIETLGIHWDEHEKTIDQL